MGSIIKRRMFNPEYEEERKNLSGLKRRIMSYKMSNPDANILEIANQCNTTPTDVQETLEECAKYYNVTI